jgi:hypothetical protein
VTKVKAAQVTAERGSKIRVRDMSKVKLLKNRPVHLRRTLEKMRFSDSESDDDYLDLDNLKTPPILEQGQEDPIVDILEQEEEQDADHGLEQEGGQLEEPGASRRPKRNRKPTLKMLENIETEEVNIRQLSPKQRKNAKANAKRKPKTRSRLEEDQDEILDQE